MALWLDNLLLRAVDAAFALRPPGPPSPANLAACRLVSHRGERDNLRVLENTYAAFDPLRGSGVAGIEFDVRWTRDFVPVVYHDADLRRLYGEPDALHDLTWVQLRQRRPEIPSLHDLVRRYVDEFHLMVELKHGTHEDAAMQDRRLAEALEPALRAGRCHVLSLRPDRLKQFPSIPANRTLGVARTNIGRISAEALAGSRAGIATQYVVLRGTHIRRHQAAGQVVGSGFAQSAAVLFREINRGVDWIFTNHALRLQRVLDDLSGARA